MRTIIACTDFSPSATNAVQYAAALTKATKARLVLFHHFTYPIPATDMPAAFPTVFVDEMAADLERQLEELKIELEHSYHIGVECAVRSWILSSDLTEVFEKERADLVVMGMQGKGAVANVLFGSVSSATIRHGKLPLLVVPRGVTFHPIKQILFPCDNHAISNPETLRSLRFLATAFDAHINVFTLIDMVKSYAPKGSGADAKANLEMLLEGTRHGYTYEDGESVDHGILYEAARSSADLVAMIPHHHSFLSNLLNQSNTQRVAATIMLPLLVLCEKAKKAEEKEEELEELVED